MPSLLLALLLSAGASPNATLSPTPSHGTALRALESYEELSQAFESSVAEWRKELKAADREGRQALRENPPAQQYLPRFEELANAGEGRALLWIVENIRDMGYGKTERADKSNQLFERLVANHLGQPWFGDVLTLIDRRNRGDEAALALYEQVLTNAKSEPVVAYASFLLGKSLLDSNEPKSYERGEQLMNAAIAKGGEAGWVRQAKQLLSNLTLKPGKLAPDFDGQTIDGHNFKLSDYRGKVVLLDFYGFW